MRPSLSPRSPTLICPVRECGASLERRDRQWVCARGHSFDVARSGYVNLLQPQDRRSKQPGDPKETVEARRRFLEAGHGGPLLQALVEEVVSLGLPAGAALLDVGCGEGFFLAGIASERPVEAHGLDLSTPAVDHAARRYPGITWVVANADRLLPYAAGSFDLVLSIDARVNPREMRRVLSPRGFLLLAVPADDDLVELRAAVLGEGLLKDRTERAVSLLAEHFELAVRRSVRQTLHLDADGVRDALAATYRGARQRQRERIAEIREMEVTSSHDLARFRPRLKPEAS